MNAPRIRSGQMSTDVCKAAAATASPRTPVRTLRLSIVAALIILTAQGWTGDFVNLFSPFPTGPVGRSLGGLLSAVSAAGLLALYHALEGATLLILSILVLALSYRATRERSVRIVALVAMIAIISATVGGVLFVLSAFQNNANSAQMGGSFIGAYAFYFIELYLIKAPKGS